MQGEEGSGGCRVRRAATAAALDSVCCVVLNVQAGFVLGVKGKGFRV